METVERKDDYLQKKLNKILETRYDTDKVNILFAKHSKLLKLIL